MQTVFIRICFPQAWPSWLSGLASSLQLTLGDRLLSFIFSWCYLMFSINKMIIFKNLVIQRKKLIQHAPLHEIIIFRKLGSAPSYLLPLNVPVEIVQQGLIPILLSNPCLSRATTHKYPGTFSTFLAINIDDRGFEGRK